MVFSSILFLLYFLPVFMLVYVLLPQKAKNYWVLLVSILFYAWGAPNFLYVVLCTSILDFYLVRALYKSEKQQHKKILLTTSLVLNLGLLAYFKYANFFIENVNAALGSLGIEQLAWTQVALPIGISFFTFQTLTYAIEVYRNEHAPFERPDHYLLYKLIFPHAIAGPIIRFKSVAQQVVVRIETPDDRLIGLLRFSIGLAKKVLIANVLAKQADLYMGAELSGLNTTQAWVGIVAYTFQIYFDFSGYSDMAIGLARMMGFHFPENFDSPYTSGSITEFWRRWHITLGAFMRDFLYIPLGGNRVKSKWRFYLNLWLVFLISGLWHGASWNFVLWGAFHGVFLILDRLFLLKVLEKIGRVPAAIFTFFVVAMAWVLFRLEEWSMAKQYFIQLFDFNDFKNIELNNSFYFMLLLALVFSVFGRSIWGQQIARYLEEKDKVLSLGKSLIFLTFSILLLLISIAYLAASEFNPFIYYRF
ncbi:MAG: MBOAT family protein [Crocinitomicaceae bacterium]|nr:MBOAT family protein [Crocinitomicaceae bacterium]MDP4724303.1 MBOAT family protein [Crocinitomicaceae bacterium]MDP4806092.1 MBOAT family protein [Crocinitomicaceae bacterium]MDP4955129.1 MBOAT family protein [Crocinitomicaceae bacterium]